MRSSNCEKRLLVSSCLSVCPHGKTGLQLDVFLWNLMFEYFSKLCRENLIFIQIWQEFTGTLHEDLRKFIITSRYVHLRLRNVLEKSCTDSWMKIDQLDFTCFIILLFNAHHVSNVSTSIFRSLRLICWVISWVVLLWFDVCWCYCVSLHKDTTPPQPNHTVTPTHVEPEQYNPWNNSTNKSQAPEDGCTNIRNMMSIK